MTPTPFRGRCWTCGHDHDQDRETYWQLLQRTAALAAQPEQPIGLDAVRQAIEERDDMEQKYHALAEQMVYHGNSVSWWHSKATAYRDAIDKVWDALRAAGIRADGTKTCADGVRELAALAAQPTAEPVAWRWNERGHWFDWKTDWSHHDRAKEMGFQIEYAYTLRNSASRCLKRRSTP